MYYVFIHVISWTDSNGDVDCIVIRDSIDGSLNGRVITGAINIDCHYTVSGGSDPFVTMVLSRVGGRSISSVVKH